MSTIKVTNIQDTAGGNSSTSAEIYSGRAKAWVNWNGAGTVAIRADFNVNTISDNGTGDYTVNFSSAMSDANYAVNFWGQRGDGNGSNYGWLGTYDTSGGVTQTASAYRCNSHNSVGTLTDWGVLYVSIFR